MDNPNLIVRTTKGRGKGVFAKSTITKGEVIAEFDGRIYGYYSKFWTQDLEDHCIQFAERKWRDSKGIGRLLNHSCDPNCGIKNKFQVVAMRDIAAGEELTWDYDMSEDTDTAGDPYQWSMSCRCGSPKCRGHIGEFAKVPAATRKKYRGYISDWLVAKYGL